MSTLTLAKQSTYPTKTINIIFTWRHVNIGTSQTKHLPDWDYKHHIHLEACKNWHKPNKASTWLGLSYSLGGRSTLAQVKQSTYLTETINIIFTWRHVNIGTSQTKHLPDWDYKHHIHLEACKNWHKPNKASTWLGLSYSLGGMSTLAQAKQSTYQIETINIIFTWRHVKLGTSQTKHLPDWDYHIHLEAGQHWHKSNKTPTWPRL